MFAGAYKNFLQNYKQTLVEHRINFLYTLQKIEKGKSYIFNYNLEISDKTVEKDNKNKIIIEWFLKIKQG